MQITIPYSLLFHLVINLQNHFTTVTTPSSESSHLRQNVSLNVLFTTNTGIPVFPYQYMDNGTYSSTPQLPHPTHTEPPIPIGQRAEWAPKNAQSL